eukprot:GILI01006434.1.p1 GENE.GILI01006434.1~~GILI01006434.1.p1  ORF type:complete len:197 (-),score=88.72 GILI01006434.1:154-672(-)
MALSFSSAPAQAEQLATSAAAVAPAANDVPSFPSFDAFHANCKLQATFKGQQCLDLYHSLEKGVISGLVKDPSNGLYELLGKDEGKLVLRATRTTPVKKYVDDVILQLVQQGDNCFVEGKSRSQSLSYYDYSTNFCNLYNPLRVLDIPFDKDVQECKFHPADEEIVATCDKY